MDSVVCFVNTYPLDSDLSGGESYPAFEQLEPDDQTRRTKLSLQPTNLPGAQRLIKRLTNNACTHRMNTPHSK